MSAEQPTSNSLSRQELYEEAFVLLSRAQDLLEQARASHERAMLAGRLSDEPCPDCAHREAYYAQFDLVPKGTSPPPGVGREPPHCPTCACDVCVCPNSDTIDMVNCPVHRKPAGHVQMSGICMPGCPACSTATKGESL